MPRVLCIWFPKWPIQRLRISRPELRRSEPVLFAGHAQRPSIVACSNKAQRLGLRIGQPLAEARALLPRAVFLPADPAADRAALCQLAIEFQCFTPLVGLEEMSEPECLLCEVAGCTHLWNGEEKISRCRAQLLARARLPRPACAGRHAGNGLGPRPYVRLTRWSLPGMKKRALSNRPVTVLRLPALTLERLEALGLYTIGEVIKLPRDTLASRFGAILPRRIDQALGLLPDTFVCERLKEPLTAFREWEVPIDDRFAVNHFAGYCCESCCQWPGASAWVFSRSREKFRPKPIRLKIEIRLVEPTRDEPHLARARRAAARTSDVVRRRHGGSLVRTSARIAGTRPGPLVRR